jgi:hypothetical protein
VLRVLQVPLVALALAGCGARENIRPSAPVALKADEAIFFLGISPRVKIQVFRGTTENGIWSASQLRSAEINITPDTHYIVVKVRATAPAEQMAITRLLPLDGTVWVVCRNALSPLFTLKPGTVNYLGELAYTLAGGEAQYAYGADDTAAREFLKQNYPEYLPLLDMPPIRPAQVKPECDHLSPPAIPAPVR